MLLWRISNHADLIGLGGQKLSARWHTARAGKRIVYLTEHPAVALIENLANLRGDPRLFQKHFQLLKITGPGQMQALELSTDQLAGIDPEDQATTRAIGDSWLAAQSSSLLRVPSIPSPKSWNYLLNPLHPDAALLTLEWARHITYDKRLFRLQ